MFCLRSPTRGINFTVFPTNATRDLRIIYTHFIGVCVFLEFIFSSSLHLSILFSHQIQINSLTKTCIYCISCMYSLPSALLCKEKDLRKISFSPVVADWNNFEWCRTSKKHCILFIDECVQCVHICIAAQHNNKEWNGILTQTPERFDKK